jgi:hypothetical protein
MRNYHHIDFTVLDRYDILYGGHKSEAGWIQGVDIDFFLLIWMSLLHNVVKRAPSLLSNGNQGIFPWG